MRENLLKVIGGPPTEHCVNQLLRVCRIDNTPVAWNRVYKLLNRIRFYHKVKSNWSKVVPYSEKDADHEAMLNQLWVTLRPNE